ncbi:RNA polymerase-associated protein CTR9-like protein [Hypsibius exemplaris]|uniref:RNA polymerase-associated protein CTR9-like protein n=1 Tax=Hypsibius exemplaris TaxID=2072580 RepID=A0A1W0WT55_HYPEX|nr:RNA polymerase-associated protein CTR9-like protein [Hypsibius exemplaris]
MSISGDIQLQPPPDYWGTNFRQEKEFEIPLKQGSEGVVLDLDNLPDKDEILDVLRNEEAPTKVWTVIALHYHVRGRTDVCAAIFEEARDRISHGHLDTSEDAAFCLDLLANYYTLQFMEKKAEKERKELRDRIKELFVQVDKLFLYSRYHLLVRGFFTLLDHSQGDIKGAATQFDYVLLSAPNDALALQGRGMVAFQQKDYKKALTCFKKVLQHHPGCSADIRVGIGHCLFKLGYLEKARMAYNRAIQLDPDCSEARIGLGLILWNEGTSSSLEKALHHIVYMHKRDVEAKRVNPVNLNILADHYFFRRDPDVALKLATAAIHSSFNDILKAESAYSVGRSYHYQEDYAQAFQYYYQATVQFPKPSYLLPWFGRGQMHIEKREYPLAITCFETVLAGSPNNVETLKILGLLYLTADVKDKRSVARTYLKRVTEMCPDDVDAHIKFAELQESIDPVSALNTYLRVIQIFSDQNEDRNETPPEILNNISCLYFKLGQIERSREFLDLARSRATASLPMNPVHYKAILTTMMYNHGRILEELRDTEEAENCYRNIAEGDQPKYLDCYLRYGCIARDKGNILKASDWFKEAAHANADHPDSHLLLGNLHMAKGEYGPAQKKYEKVLDNPTTKTDTYALLSLGNIWLETLYQNIPDVEKKKRHAERAFMLYKQVLKLDPTNVYAVNGMGAVLAKTGQLEEAKEMFSVVRESTADILDLWLNIGHSYCDQRQYVAGIKMYENALKRFKEASLDPTIFLYLARAQYFHGDLKDARKTLQLARRLAPQNQALRYNLAVVMKRMALLTFGDARNATIPTYAEVQGAVEDLKVAQKIFDFLSTEGDKAVVDMVRADREKKKCADLILISASKLNDARDNDEKVQAKRQVNEEARRAYQELIMKEEMQAEEAKRKQQEELLRKRQEVLMKTNEVKEKIIREHAEEGNRPVQRKRTRKEAGLPDEFIDDQGNVIPGPGGEGGAPKRHRGEGGERRRIKAARRKRREDRLEQGLPPLSSGEENDEPEGDSPRPARRTKEPEYDRKGRKLKSAAFISDSDSSSSSSDSDAEGGDDKKTAASGGDESDAGEKRNEAKKALASSSDDDNDGVKKNKSPSKAGGKVTRRKALAGSSDDEDADADRKPVEKKAKKVVSDDEDDDMKDTDAQRHSAEPDHPDDEEDIKPAKKSKLSLNDSDSDF